MATTNIKAACMCTNDFCFLFHCFFVVCTGAAVQSKAGKFTNRNAPSAIIMEVCILLKSSWYRTNLPLILRRAIKMLVFANKSTCIHSFICSFIHSFCIRPSVVSVFLACDQPFSLAVFCVSFLCFLVPTPAFIQY